MTGRAASGGAGRAGGRGLLTCRERSFGRPYSWCPGRRRRVPVAPGLRVAAAAPSAPGALTARTRSPLAPCSGRGPGVLNWHVLNWADPSCAVSAGRRPPPVPSPRSAGTEPPREVAVRCRAALGGRGERSPAGGERRWAGLGCPPAPLLAVPARRSCGKALFLVGGNSDLCLFR